LTNEKVAGTILPHGGKLIQRELFGEQRESYLNQLDSLKSIKLSSWSLSDLELIAIGGFSPLIGFMGKADYTSVINNMSLNDGTIRSEERRVGKECRLGRGGDLAGQILGERSGGLAGEVAEVPRGVRSMGIEHGRGQVG